MPKKPTIQRKPRKAAETPASIEAFLGGNATAKETSPGNTPKRGRPRGSQTKGNFRQSVPQTILDDLDAHIEALQNRPSRNAWIIAAIIEKLDRDA